MNLTIYKIVKCVKCKTYQMTTAKKTFKCVKCNTSKPISKMTIHYESGSPQEVTKALQKIKKENFKIQNDTIDDNFSSAL